MSSEDSIISYSNLPLCFKLIFSKLTKLLLLSDYNADWIPPYYLGVKLAEQMEVLSDELTALLLVLVSYINFCGKKNSKFLLKSFSVAFLRLSTKTLEKSTIEGENLTSSL